MPVQLRVRAVEGASVSFVAPDGAVLRGRFVARTAPSVDLPHGAVMPEGEFVDDLPHYQRAIAQGSLVLVDDAPAAPPQPARVPAPAPSPVAPVVNAASPSEVQS